ncbi:MAG TPA: bifunctional isocitrate dehydrogenase kinase/phosphatase [Myxococcaceae bacterium]|nr:bifunctional isocitrate dehydrogenase kinase/phosphatase [Myxococcaceae bacterium]
MSTPQAIARTILDGFEKRWAQFREQSAAAKECFEQGDREGAHALNRLGIGTYDARVRESVESVLRLHPDARTDETLWPQVKQALIGLLYEHKRPECAETFYNSVACRVLDRTYYRNEYIFWRQAVATEFIEADELTWRSWYPTATNLMSTFTAIARSLGLSVPFENLRRDLRKVLIAFGEHLPGHRERQLNFQVQLLSSLFFRDMGAYVVGRLLNGNQQTPFVACIRHAQSGRGLYVDALLLKGEHLAALFSLSRACFIVDMDVPSEFVTFLNQLMPGKSKAELYTSVGLQKQGKTLFYRDLHWSLKHSTDAFVPAPGVRGMVMMVFTLPSFPWVFKVIRDEFPPPKQISREEVRAKYLLVKYHDRVGRLPDALEYSDVLFPAERMHPAVIEELERSCARSVEREGDRLVLKHLYVERRMTPLDLWLDHADPAQRSHGVREFGWAIRDLAEANIFPGDLLLKNFGMTGRGRVVFYDYDEISLLTDVTFRRMPSARDEAEESSAEPWFHVGPRDVFPEEFLRFLFPPGRLRDLFVEMHGELLDPAWWIARQEDIRAGRQPDPIPYPDEVRLGRVLG